MLLMQFLAMPLWLAPHLPAWKKIVSLTAQSFDLCKKHVDAAIARVDEQDGKTR